MAFFALKSTPSIHTPCFLPSTPLPPLGIITQYPGWKKVIALPLHPTCLWVVLLYPPGQLRLAPPARRVMKHIQTFKGKLDYSSEPSLFSPSSWLVRSVRLCPGTPPVLAPTSNPPPALEARRLRHINYHRQEELAKWWTIGVGQQELISAFEDYAVPF